MTFQESVDFARRTIGLDHPFKEKQLETLSALFSGFDCLSVLPTGYGKSAIFQSLPWVFQSKRGASEPFIVIVVSPLSSLMQDQVLALCEKGLNACYLNCEGTLGNSFKLIEGEGEGEIDDDEEDQDDTTNDVAVWSPKHVSKEHLRKGAYNIVYAHPETLLRNKDISRMLKNKTYQQRVCAVVFDEVHMVSEWGQSFRTAFGNLHELVALFSESVHLAMTATATPSAIKTTIEELQLVKPKIIAMNPDRVNICLEVHCKLYYMKKYEKLDKLLELLAEELLDKNIHFPVTIVYIYQLETLGYCYQFISDYLGEQAYYPRDKMIPENILFCQFHADYTQKMKNFIVSELRKENPSVRLVFATVSLGMGLNAPSVVRVIHFRPPTSLEKYFQELGRAGRNDDQAKSIMYYNMSDIAPNRIGMTHQMREFCLNKTSCLRKKLLEYFGFNHVLYSGHPDLCCTNCRGNMT